MTHHQILDINLRAVAKIALAYAASSLVAYFFGVSLLFLWVKALSVQVAMLATLFTGPPGILVALKMLPEHQHVYIVTMYPGFTLLMALLLVFSCHRNPNVRMGSVVMAALAWLAGGFTSVAFNFAYAA